MPKPSASEAGGDAPRGASSERPRADDPALIASMRDTLRAEYGARSMYDSLSGRVRDRELGPLLERFCEEEQVQIERLRALLAGLSISSSASAWRRSTLSRLFALSAFVGGKRLCLRLCHDSESMLQARYREYARFLGRAGNVDAALVCDELALTKERHARSLEAWIGWQ